MLANLIHKCRGNSPELLFEWFIISQLFNMLSSIITANLVGFQGEDLVESGFGALVLQDDPFIQVDWVWISRCVYLQQHSRSWPL